MKTLEQDVSDALRILKHGGVILYPTDTVWGIGCDATRTEAVRRVFELKQRADSKALVLLVDSVDSLYNTVANVPDVAIQLIDASDRPVTVIYDRALPLAPGVSADDGSVAVRVTSEIVSKALCSKLRRPLVSTSANISGQPTPVTFSEISDEIKSGVDYIMEHGRDYLQSKPSIIIKISDDSSFRIIRK